MWLSDKFLNYQAKANLGISFFVYYFDWYFFRNSGSNRRRYSSKRTKFSWFLEIFLAENWENHKQIFVWAFDETWCIRYFWCKKYKNRFHLTIEKAILEILLKNPYEKLLLHSDFGDISEIRILSSNVMDLYAFESLFP